MSQENWWINDYEVKVFVNNEVVKTAIVRSKAARSAITNVLTNLYSGDVDSVKVKQLTFYTEQNR